MNLHKPIWVICIVTSLLTLAFAACGGGGDSEPAAAAFEDVLAQITDGQFSQAYDSLHPEQQKLIAREDFIDCYDAEGTIPDAEVLDVENAYDEDIQIPGTNVTAPSRALTLRVRVSNGDVTEEDTDTFHMWPVGEEWAWTLTAEWLESCLL